MRGARAGVYLHHGRVIARSRPVTPLHMSSHPRQARDCPDDGAVVETRTSSPSRFSSVVMPSGHVHSSAPMTTALTRLLETAASAAPLHPVDCLVSLRQLQPRLPLPLPLHLRLHLELHLDLDLGPRARARARPRPRAAAPDAASISRSGQTSPTPSSQC